MKQIKLTDFKENIIFLSIAFLIFCLFSGCASVPGKNEVAVQKSGEIVNLAPYVTKDMLNADFWANKSRNPDKILMPVEKIQLWNENNQSLDNSSVIDLRAQDLVMTGEEIRRFLYRYNPELSLYRKKITKNGEEIQKLKKSDFKELYDLMNYSRLGTFSDFMLNGTRSDNKTDFKIERGICVKRGDLKLVPADYGCTDDIEYWYDDLFQNSGILMNEPVLILWKSVDEEWYFVRTAFCTGWIKKDFIAICPEEEFNRYFDYGKKSQESFITITEDRFVLEKNSFFSQNSDEKLDNCELFMGTYLYVLPWSDEIVQQIQNRMPHACYLVEIPFRKEDGTLGKKYAEVPAGKAHSGFLPYTSRNILKLAFASLGKPYGWGGMRNERDCSEYLLEIFRCFGFSFPRNSRGQMGMPGKTVSFSGKTLTQRKKLLSKLEPGINLGMSGHVLMYLGTHNGRYYAISALGSYYPDSHYAETVDANSVTVNTLDVTRKNKKSWLLNLEVAKELSLRENEKSPWIEFNENWKFGNNSKIKNGKAFLYRASRNRKNIVVAVNAGHGTKDGVKHRVYSHPDKSPKLTGGSNPEGAVESIAVTGGMVFKDGTSEAEINLRTARILKDLLVKAGYDVLMLRNGNDVQLDNIARTVMANNMADIHVAIHYDSDNFDKDKGVFFCSIPEGLTGLKNVREHSKKSSLLGQCLVKGLFEEGCPVYEDGSQIVDLMQTSYSTIPTSDIELGNQYSAIDKESVRKRALGLFHGIEYYFDCLKKKS